MSKAVKKVDKTGRVDLLVSGISGLLLDHVEGKTSIAGLKNSLMPIIAKQIEENIPANTKLPKEYIELGKLLTRYMK
jgi:hypothetical protein